ncbi:type II toxin-antitoxin system VapC family toxin [soil metagenome]
MRLPLRAATDANAMPVVLDSWAVMRLLEGVEPAASRVQEVIDSGDAVMSWMNLGEILYILRRSHGADAASRTVNDIEGTVRVMLPDRQTVVDAATIKSTHSMSYADAFAAATAMQLAAELWTGDPELLVDDAPWHPFDPSA